MKIFLKKALILFLFLLIANYALFAGKPVEPDINWFEISANMIGGLALFLFGMARMSESLRKSAGNHLRAILSKLTNNRFLGFFAGLIVTMAIQSGSATTVMLVGFVQSGLMSFAQSFSVLLGANIGNTLTGQLIAFSITDYALPVVALGFAISTFSKKNSVKYFGDTILGFGLLFFGLHLMNSALTPIHDMPEFLNMLKTLDKPVAGVLVGLAVTAMIQSSGAFTGIVIVLAQQNLIGTEAAISLVIGANVGSVSTAWLVSASASREAKRVALVHTVAKVTGALIFVFWIPQCAEFLKLLSENVGRQTANAHTIFNLTLAFVFLPFSKIVTKLITKLLPDDKRKKSHLVTKFINKHALKTPEPAIDLVILEISRALHILSRMLETVILTFIQKDIPKDKYHPELDLIQALDMREEEIDFLETAITDYIIELSRKDLNENRMAEIFGLMSIVNDIEHTADIIHKDMIPMIAQKQALGADFSEDGRADLISYHEKMMKQLSRLANVFEKKDAIQAVKVMVKGETYDILETQYRHRHFMRFNQEKPATLQTHQIHTDLFDALKQISIYLENIAKTVAETAPFGRNYT